MPDHEELEQRLLASEMKANLDPYEISVLHQMADAAKIMDAMDAEGGADGDEAAAPELG